MMDFYPDGNFGWETLERLALFSDPGILSFSLPYFIPDPKITSHWRVCSCKQNNLIQYPLRRKMTFMTRLMVSVSSLLSDWPTASALVGHFAGISALYLLQGGLNLVSPPATCRIPNKEILEGLDFGNYLKRGSEREITTHTWNRNVDHETCV